MTVLLRKQMSTAPCGRSVKPKNFKKHLKVCSNPLCLAKRQKDKADAQRLLDEEKANRLRQQEAAKTSENRWRRR